MNWGKSWADDYIKDLEEGKTIKCRPHGNSMEPIIKSGQLVTISPIKERLKVGDIVLCRVKGNVYLHFIKQITYYTAGIVFYIIGNNKGYINGATQSIFGILTKIED